MSKQLNIWSFDPIALKRSLNSHKRRPPFIGSALVIRDLDYILTGHQSLYLTLWDRLGSHRLTEVQIESDDRAESTVKNLYHIGSFTDHDRLSAFALVITQKSTRSYLYHLPRLTCESTLDYPQALSEHLLIHSSTDTSFFVTTFERERRDHPVEAPKYSHQLWIWPLTASILAESPHAEFTPWIQVDHTDSIVGISKLGERQLISWDQSGEMRIWTLTHEGPELDQMISITLDKASIQRVVVSDDATKIIVKYSGAIDLWVREGDRGIFVRLEFDLPYAQVHEAYFVNHELLYLCAYHVGSCLLQVTSHTVELQHSIDEAPFSEIIRIKLISSSRLPQRLPQGLIIYEHRRRDHVWLWKWGEALQLIHKSELYSQERVERLDSDQFPQLEILSDHVIFASQPNQVGRWYNTEGTTWSVVEQSESHLILKMNRELYPLSLPLSLSHSLYHD